VEWMSDYGAFWQNRLDKLGELLERMEK
jgi:hypothetical protein